MKINELKEGKVYLNLNNNMKYALINGVLMLCSFKDEIRYEESLLTYNKVAKFEFMEIKKYPTEKEIAVLGLLPDKWKYIAKDEDGKVHVYNIKPIKCIFGYQWCLNTTKECVAIAEFLNIPEILELTFDFISWDDSEPTLISDIISQGVVK